MACWAAGKKKERKKLFLYTRQFVVLRSLKRRMSEKYLNTVLYKVLDILYSSSVMTYFGQYLH